MKCNTNSCNHRGKQGPIVMTPDDGLLAVLDNVNFCLDDTDEDEGSSILFQYGREFFCYPCLCILLDQCVHCGEEVDTLHRDTRCQGNLYICAECLKGLCPHLWECYGSGCMTIEELAESEQMILESESQNG